MQTEDAGKWPDAPPRSEAFENLAAAAGQYLRDCQKRLDQQYRAAQWLRYEWSQDTRHLVFSEDGRSKVIADIQFVGSISSVTNTWLWAWDNNTVDQEFSQASLQIRQYGERHGFPHLTIPKWHAEEADGWEMTSIAAYLTGAKGAYRSPDENILYFMIMTAVRWVE
jgi:hypothetical protein